MELKNILAGVENLRAKGNLELENILVKKNEEKYIFRVRSGTPVERLCR